MLVESSTSVPLSSLKILKLLRMLAGIDSPLVFMSALQGHTDMLSVISNEP